MKKEEDAAKEAFDRTAFAEFLFGPSGRQARAVFLALGVPGDDSDGMKGGVDPSDEAQAPIGGIQADDARADGVEAHRPFQEGTSKRSIMDVGGREQVENGQAGAAKERTRMLGWGMTDSGVGVSAAPGQDGSAIDDQITCPDQPTPQGRQHAQDEECLGSRRSGSLTALALLGGTGNAWPPVVTKGQAASQG